MTGHGSVCAPVDEKQLGVLQCGVYRGPINLGNYILNFARLKPSRLYSQNVIQDLLEIWFFSWYTASYSSALTMAKRFGVPEDRQTR